MQEQFGWKVALSPDAETIAYGDARTVKLWDIKAQKQRLRSSGHDSAIWSIDFAPDGKTLASCADDSVRLWDIARRTEIRQWDTGASHRAWHLRFSKDGETVVTANSEHVELRDPSTGELKASFVAEKAWGLSEARVAPDLKTVVSVDALADSRVERRAKASDSCLLRSSGKH